MSEIKVGLAGGVKVRGLTGEAKGKIYEVYSIDAKELVQSGEFEIYNPQEEAHEEKKASKSKE